MSGSSPDHLEEDERRRYLRRRGAELSSVDAGGPNGLDGLDRQQLSESLPDGVSVEDVTDGLPGDVDELDAEDLRNWGSERASELDGRDPPIPTDRPTEPLSFPKRLLWALFGLVYALTVRLYDKEVVNAAHVSRAPSVAGSTGGEGISWSIEQVNPGGTVYVPAEGPDEGNVWLLDDWIDVERDNVTIEGDGPNRTLLVAEEGANVGGIRIGAGDGETRSDVTVRGIGYDGNGPEQDQRVKRLHGIIVEDAERVLVENCFFTRTSPYHEHDSGGSGITVRHAASEVRIDGNWVDDIGDRGIQVAGEQVLIRGNAATNGYDRNISLDVTEPDGYRYHARGATVVNNVGRDNANGSMIGASTVGQVPQPPNRGHVAIVGNVATGAFRRLVSLNNGINQGAAIVGNVGIQEDQDEVRSGVKLEVGDEYGDDPFKNVAVVGNVLDGFTREGIRLDNTHGFSVVGNVVRDVGSDGVQVFGGSGTVALNYVRGASENGLNVGAGAVSLTGNVVESSGDHGVFLQPFSTPNSIADRAVNADEGEGTAGEGSVAEQAPDDVPHSETVDAASTTGPDNAATERTTGRSDNATNTLLGNLVRNSNKNDSGADEFRLQDSSLLVVGNRVVSRNGRRSFAEAEGADGNLYVGNRAPTDDAAWELIGADSRGVGNAPAFYRLDRTATFAGGETSTFPVPNTRPGDDLRVSAAPASAGGTHGYDVESVRWNDTRGQLEVRVAETESESSGLARVTAKKIDPGEVGDPGDLRD